MPRKKINKKTVDSPELCAVREAEEKILQQIVANFITTYMVENSDGKNEAKERLRSGILDLKEASREAEEILKKLTEE